MAGAGWAGNGLILKGTTDGSLAASAFSCACAAFSAAAAAGRSLCSPAMARYSATCCGERCSQARKRALVRRSPPPRNSRYQVAASSVSRREALLLASVITRHPLPAQGQSLDDVFLHHVRRD